MITSESARLAQLFQAVDRLERKVDFILKHLNLDFDEADAPEPSYMAEIYDLVRRGNKIEAIKLYRGHTGLGLAEAKAAIDALEIKLKLS
ncbi:MAG TPA: ribosomal protein L7/L12 [Anaerolineae bacterium]|nr:ribosomal protein L7/L12 [Anaerolineae bacterium]